MPRFYLNYLDSKAAKAEARLKMRQMNKSKLKPQRHKAGSNLFISTNDTQSSSNVEIGQSQTSELLDDLTNSISTNLDFKDQELNDGDDGDELDIDDDEDNNNDDGDVDDDLNFGDDLYNDDSDEYYEYDQAEMQSTNMGIASSNHMQQLFGKSINGKSVAELEQMLVDLQSNLNDILDESARLDKQIQGDTLELAKRSEELDRATTQYNDQKQGLIMSEDEMLCLESRLNYAKIHLNRLQRTNVLNIAFPIWYDGHIGVINGLHLGRLSNRPVGWEEINAAWGQCALLLQCMGKKLDYVYQNHRIVPMGSQSKIIQLSGLKEYPLYYTTGGMRLLSAGKFDTAMFNFLDCLNQIQQIIEHVSNIQLPHRIKDRGKLQDPDGQLYSIRWNGNTEENWTKALKMMLINMKWIIAGLSMRRSGAIRSAETPNTPSGNTAQVTRVQTNPSSSCSNAIQSHNEPHL